MHGAMKLTDNGAMSPAPSRSPSTAALRLARQSWRLLYSDSHACVAAAEQAFQRGVQRGDAAAEGWARLTRGFHMIWYATPQEAAQELNQAQRCFAAVHDRAGQLLAEVGLARCDWREGRLPARRWSGCLPLRDEGLRILEHDERGMLLNTIAGCYSELGQSQQAFAYMYQALRETNRRQEPRLRRGAVLQPGARADPAGRLPPGAELPARRAWSVAGG